MLLLLRLLPLLLLLLWITRGALSPFTLAIRALALAATAAALLLLARGLRQGLQAEPEEPIDTLE